MVDVVGEIEQDYIPIKIFAVERGNSSTLIVRTPFVHNSAQDSASQSWLARILVNVQPTSNQSARPEEPRRVILKEVHCIQLSTLQAFGHHGHLQGRAAYGTF